MKNALIIFLKYPELGRAKTRLAKSIGDEKTLQIYIALLNHTKSITQSLACDVFLYYDKPSPQYLDWERENAHNTIQFDGDLGERMKYAFEDVFDKQYTKVAIIGSDCYELTREIIEDAFLNLDSYDVVFGPAKDGGYYLLGLKENQPVLFDNINWSTATVLEESIKKAKKEHLKASFLTPLSDVDTFDDLPLELKKLIDN